MSDFIAVTKIEIFSQRMPRILQFYFHAESINYFVLYVKEILE